MKKSLVFSLSLLGYVGFATATPAVLFGFLGRYLDKYFNSSPKFLITLMILALIVSLLMVKRIAQKAAKDLNKINK